MKKNHLKIIFWFSTFLLLCGCYPQDNNGYVNEYDLVATNYDKDFNFSANKTYALPDSIVLIGDQTLTGQPIFVDQATATLILNQIRTNLNGYGWTETDSLNADIILLPSASKTTNIYYYYDWSYWGWYYPGYYPGYGWGYPGYAPYPVATSYQTGTLLMQMTYPAGIEASSVPVVWSGVINGLLNVGSTTSVNSRITTTINQAFTQSPYLK
ncbi:DUF4136 domain-containing protein [Cytophaga aurantiaca]|uniref:DUF4136 domain-containing protein n=1 Tax=Cytophaga aurantiaca TaxID=29530 RepID=UPI0003643949|nr:DUF4136 domain-containing protein [Cytophaga aurantiaca]